MKNYELISLGNALSKTKVGSLSNENLRKYLRLMIEYNKVNAEFDEKRRTLATETLKTKGFDAEKLTPEQEAEVVSIISPILDEYALADVDVPTKFLTWDELYDSILSNSENNSIDVNTKSMITSFLCSEDV